MKKNHVFDMYIKEGESSHLATCSFAKFFSLIAKPECEMHDTFKFDEHE